MRYSRLTAAHPSQARTASGALAKHELAALPCVGSEGASMLISRRALLTSGAAAAGLATLGPARLFPQEAAASLRPLTGDVVPISRDEHLARIAKAQRLMGEAGL